MFSRPPMSVKSILAAIGLALAGVVAGSSASAQTQTPTPEQIQAFNSLPQDQQQAIVQSVMGTGTGTGTPNQVNPVPGMPNAVVPNNRGLNGSEEIKPDETRDGHYLRRSNEDPELRANDSVLIQLTLESQCSGASAAPAGGNPNGPTGTPGAAAGAGNGNTAAVAPNAGNTAQIVPCIAAGGESGAAAEYAQGGGSGSNASEYGGGSFQGGHRSVEQQRRLKEFRERILSGNPYRLNRYGAIEIPGLPAIALAGLTQTEASARLTGDPNLKGFYATLTLLRLRPYGEAALKPFGYDLFEGVPSTFAPVSDLPVPPDYVVGPGDTLDVQLYGNEPGSYLLPVQRTGRVDFPKLGPIMVSGMSFDAAQSVIQRRVARQLIGTRVSVTMGGLRTIRVFVLGEAKQPGSYTVGGLSTMTNALFASGGIKKSGSLRNIELKRNGRLVTVLDLYDLLLHGDTSGDRQLLPGDVIFIPPIGNTVAIGGEVRRPAIYELKSERTIAQLIDIAGGLLPDADPTLVHLQRISRAHTFEMQDVDLTTSAGRDTRLADGDKVRVAPILPTLENSVKLTGYVYRPGSFEFHQGLRLSDIIPSFEDLRPTADPHYIMIRRKVPPDNQVQVVSADLEKALAARGTSADPKLEPRDKIYVFDLSASRTRLIEPIIKRLQLQATPSRPAQIVRIDGQVKAPGQYALEPQMRVSDLIRAGGSLDDAAFGAEAELTRYHVVAGQARESELLNIDLDAIRRGDAAADIELQPYDLLVVKTVPQWRTPGSVIIAGEVRFPGKYPIHQGETLHSVLIRAGGLTANAFPDGAVFTREELKAKEKAQLELLANRFQSDLTALSLSAVAGGASGTSGGAAAAAGAAQGAVVGQQLLYELRNTKPVGRLVINVNRVLHGPAGGAGDVMLRDGDLLFVPKKTQEITIMGEVQNPTSQIYQPGWTRDDYIRKTGGVTQNADKKRIYVVRANGDVVGGERSGWFRRTQSVAMRPGDTIVVPLNADHIPALPLWTALTTILYNIAIAVLALKSL